MIDLHMHTSYSDGEDSVENLLKKCEEKHLEVIAITDHNTCKQYEDEVFKNDEYKRIYSGKIIKGVELSAAFQDRRIEVLGYNIKDTSIIENWSQKFFSDDILRKQQELAKKKLLDICDKKGLVYNLDAVNKDIPLTDFPTTYIFFDLIKHKENQEILSEFNNSLSLFIRKGLMNPNSEYCTIDDSLPKPMYRDVVDVIHNAGGLAFLAHPFEYRFDNTIYYIDILNKEKRLDGIECFHPSADSEKMNILVKYAKENNLYISGGSDYHGSKKKGIDLGVGKGNLNISKEVIEPWFKELYKA